MGTKTLATAELPVIFVSLTYNINAEKTTSAVSTYAIVDYICNARYVFVGTKTLATAELPVIFVSLTYNRYDGE